MSSNKTKDWFKNQLVTHGVQLPASNAKKNGTGEAADKYAAWVKTLTDTSLFTALRANDKNVGGIVDSTRPLFQNMLIGLVKDDPQKSVSNIQNYLSSNADANRLWNESGVDLSGITNGHSTNGTNGNENGENGNGYSDSDDDEAVETASRASRSSRASSMRSSLPPAPPQPQRAVSETSTAVRSRRAGREDALDGINEETSEDVRASPSRSTTNSDSYYNRVSSPSTSSATFNRPSTVRKTVVETYESSRSHTIDDGRTSTVFHSETRRSTQSPPKVKKESSKLVTMVKYILLFLAVVAVPIVAYLALGPHLNSENCVGSECSTDELDTILQSLENQGVDDAGTGV